MASLSKISPDYGSRKTRADNKNFLTQTTFPSTVRHY